jgi:hypothetical protein
LYIFTILIDVTLGTTIVYFLLLLTERLARTHNIHALKRSGDYGSPPNSRVWGSQLAAWLAIQTLMKLVVSVLFWAVFHPLAELATAVFSPFRGHRHAELMVVMIFGPCLLNALQFWVVDSFLKRKPESVPPLHKQEDPTGSGDDQIVVEGEEHEPLTAT